MNEDHYRKLERMYLGAPVNQFYRPRLNISDGAAELVITVREDFFHAAGAVHGAVYCKAADDSMFFAVNSLVEDVFVLTVNITTNLMRPISSGEMTARGKVVFASRNLFMAETEITNSSGARIATASGTFARSKIALSEDIGYR